MKEGIQIEIKHSLERRIIGIRDRLTACEPANSVGENIKPTETRDNLIYQTLGAIAARNLRGQRGKALANEI